jgi:hypothetical protein
VSTANDVTGGGGSAHSACDDCDVANISVAEAALHPTGLRPATLPTRGRDKKAVRVAATTLTSPRYFASSFAAGASLADIGSPIRLPFTKWQLRASGRFHMQRRACGPD